MEVLLQGFEFKHLIFKVFFHPEHTGRLCERSEAIQDSKKDPERYERSAGLLRCARKDGFDVIGTF